MKPKCKENATCETFVAGKIYKKGERKKTVKKKNNIQVHLSEKLLKDSARVEVAADRIQFIFIYGQPKQ